MRNYIMKCSAILLLISSFTIIGCKSKNFDKPGEVFGLTSYYNLVFKGENSNHDQKEVIIVTSQEKLQELMGQINSTRRPGIEIPTVDFDEETLIFAYGGKKSTGGYHVDISKIKNRKSNIHFIFEVKQDDGDMASMSITTPVKIIRVKHDDKKITASF